MQWTEAAPTEPGWYWLREKGATEPDIVRVALEPSGRVGRPPELVIWRTGYELDDAIPPGAEWCGPLTPPDGQKVLPATP